jgi:hypothetical protein
MRSLLISLSICALSLSSAVLTSACAGGVSGSFRGNGVSAPPVAPAKVKVVASKDAMTGSYTELGIAKGSAPTAQQAVDQAKFHCGNHGGTHLIMNTEPFMSGSNYSVDATCATTGPADGKAGAGKPR